MEYQPSLEYQRTPLRPQNYHAVSLGLLVLLPALMFFTVSFFFIFLTHSARPVVWIVMTICSLISLIFLSVRKPATKDGPNFWFALGVLCLLATAASTVAGEYNWRNHTARYWAYAGQRKYTEVPPSESSLSYYDAGTITFTAGSRVDLSFAFTYEGNDGKHKFFCVAPVFGPDDDASAVVNYWAAGTDCCQHGGGANFTCNDVGLGSKVNGGLVYLPLGGGRGLTSGPTLLGNFHKAAEAAAAATGLKTTPEALFVRWVQEPEKAKRAFWMEGVHFLLLTMAVQLGFSLLAGILLHCCRRAGKSKLEDRRFP